MSNVIDGTYRDGCLEIRSARDGDRHVVALVGELDMGCAGRVAQELQQVEATGAREIVLDLSDLEFIDSSGICVIVAADMRSRADGNRLRLIHGTRPVRRAFELSGLIDRLPFVEA